VAAPISILRGARAFARDVAREAMPPGFLWDVIDYVPQMIDTLLTSRGGWVWGSDVGAAADYEAGILAPFTAGEQNLGAANGALYQIATTSPYGLTARGSVPVAIQNPVMLFDQVIWMDGSGAAPPSVVTPAGNATPIAAANVQKVKVGTIWGEYFVGANAPGHENSVYFAPPDDVTQPWDPNALVQTAGAVTGLAALRTLILVFHAASIERLRGSRPPAGTNPGDLVLEPLFHQVGTTEPKTICYWQENILFADEHGVHITDGAVLRNLVQQGSILSYWRNLYNKKQTISASVFLDYYIVSVNRTDGINDTLVCDLNSRQWFRFSNIAAVSMWASGGTVGMERIWAGILGAHQLGRLSACFFPVTSGVHAADANGVNVLPYLETGFYKLAQEGRKRVRFAYLSYDARSGTLAVDEGASWQRRLREEEYVNGSGPIAAASGDVLSLAYILSPQDTTWTPAGTLPLTSAYTRYRLPVGKAPYGIAFQLSQTAPTTVTRISDLAVDAHPIDRGRV
jgi:hypothetical protein